MAERTGADGRGPDGQVREGLRERALPDPLSDFLAGPHFRTTPAEVVLPVADERDDDRPDRIPVPREAAGARPVWRTRRRPDRWVPEAPGLGTAITVITVVVVAVLLVLMVGSFLDMVQAVFS